MPAQDDIYSNTNIGEPIVWGQGESGGGEDVEASAAIFSPTIEITRVNSSPSQANLFDVAARCTFTHRNSGRSVEVEAFYRGSANEWTWRFAGDQIGLWDFITVADGSGDTTNDPELHGHTGTVQVTSDGSAYGFVTNLGTRWARQKGHRDDLETFVPQFVMVGATDGTVQDNISPTVYNTQTKRDNIINEFIGPTSNHGFTGAYISTVAGYWFNAQDSTNALTGSESDPDPETFEALEDLINAMRAAGAVVHIWPWGDRSRNQTPFELAGGLGGSVDIRLRRYIAARLGCVPGWTMGVGFDLDEWLGETELHAWHSDMIARLPYVHLLGGRPGGPNPEDGGTNSDFVSWNSPMGYASYEHHRPDHAQYADALAQFTDKPAFSEDRFRVRQDAGFDEKDYTEEMTYRGLWVSTIVGGVANIWGHLDSSTHVEGTGVYTVRDQINAYGQFWFGSERRFDLVREKDDTLTNAGWLLHASDFSAYAVYAQDVSSIQVDLSDAPGTMQVIAVDAASGAYAELDQGTVLPGIRTINLPSTSDWALWIKEAV